MALQITNEIRTRSCDHAKTKVYSGEFLPRGDRTAIWYWICSECGIAGSDDFSSSFKPAANAATYWNEMRRRHPDAWRPAHFR